MKTSFQRTYAIPNHCSHNIVFVNTCICKKGMQTYSDDESAESSLAILQFCTNIFVP